MISGMLLDNLIEDYCAEVSSAPLARISRGALENAFFASNVGSLTWRDDQCGCVSEKVGRRELSRCSKSAFECAEITG